MHYRQSFISCGHTESHPEQEDEFPVGEGKPVLAPPVGGNVPPSRPPLEPVGKGKSGREELLMERVGNAEGPTVKLAELVGDAERLAVAFL